MSLYLQQYRSLLPWLCTSLALGYAAYLTWKIRRLREENKKKPINKDYCYDPRHDVNIDAIDRDHPKKRVAYCRCWKSETFPFCDGKHKYHNKDHEDKVGPLVVCWNEPEPELKALDTSIIEHVEPDLDIKSIDSNSPILHSSNGGDSNGEFEMGDKIGDANNSSDDQLSSLEMIEDDTQPEQKESKQSNDDDDDEDTVKVETQTEL